MGSNGICHQINKLFGFVIGLIPPIDINVFAVVFRTNNQALRADFSFKMNGIRITRQGRITVPVNIFTKIPVISSAFINVKQLIIFVDPDLHGNIFNIIQCRINIVPFNQGAFKGLADGIGLRLCIRSVVFAGHFLTFQVGHAALALSHIHPDLMAALPGTVVAVAGISFGLVHIVEGKTELFRSHEIITIVVAKDTILVSHFHDTISVFVDGGILFFLEGQIIFIICILSGNCLNGCYIRIRSGTMDGLPIRIFHFTVAFGLRAVHDGAYFSQHALTAARAFRAHGFVQLDDALTFGVNTAGSGEKFFTAVVKTDI